MKQDIEGAHKENFLFQYEHTNQTECNNNFLNEKWNCQSRKIKGGRVQLSECIFFKKNKGERGSDV